MSKGLWVFMGLFALFGTLMGLGCIQGDETGATVVAAWLSVTSGICAIGWMIIEGVTAPVQ